MDENTKHGGDDGAPKPAAENAVAGNPNSAAIAVHGDGAVEAAIVAAESESGTASRQASSRTPFTNLSQVEADLALARTLQEQERAYMMLSMNGHGSNYGRWEEEYYFNDGNDDYDDPDGHGYDGIDDDQDDGDEDDDDDNNDVNDLDDDDSENDEVEEEDLDDEDDASEVHDSADSGEDEAPAVEVDPAAFPDDEAYARALQDAEEREMAARLLAMAGITEREEDENLEDHDDGHAQDAWEEVDPDELSYEELIALGEVVGTESRGLSSDIIESLPSKNYKSENGQDAEPCVICRLEYEDGDTLTLLTCKHSYHPECISNWLKINKVCPVCSTEVSTSEKS